MEDSSWKVSAVFPAPEAIENRCTWPAGRICGMMSGMSGTGKKKEGEGVEEEVRESSLLSSMGSSASSSTSAVVIGKAGGRSDTGIGSSLKVRERKKGGTTSVGTTKGRKEGGKG